MLKPVRVSAPGVPLVSLEEAKAHCRVDHSDDDDLLNGLVAAATALLDGYSGVLGRALINQTWCINLCSWPPCRIRLPLAPVSTIASIKYFDTANAEQDLAGSNFSLLEDALSPYAGWASNASLPSLFEREDAIAVEFIAGYGATADKVPEAIRLAAKLLVGDFYENREASIVGTTAEELPFAVKALIAPFRRVGV